MSEHLRKAWREAAAGLNRHEIPAEEVQEGDYLDISGKSRVHTVHRRGDRVHLGYRSRGTRSGSVRIYSVGEPVKVWRKA